MEGTLLGAFSFGGRLLSQMRKYIFAFPVRHQYKSRGQSNTTG